MKHNFQLLNAWFDLEEWSEIGSMFMCIYVRGFGNFDQAVIYFARFVYSLWLRNWKFLVSITFQLYDYKHTHIHA